jgi:hypothetical protein
MPMFRKKPVVIEAMHLTPISLAVVREWAGTPAYAGETGIDGLVIETLEGAMTARFGDWIIKGVANEFYPCKDDIFRATYEPVEELDTQQRGWTDQALENVKRRHLRLPTTDGGGRREPHET